MITISPCTNSDCPAVAQLWNAQSLEADSCWFQAETVDAAYVSSLLAAGYTVSIAQVDGQMVGFGFWCGPAEFPRLVALAANSPEEYYRLMAEFCAWGIAAGATRGFAEIGTRDTIEKARMDALEVIAYTPIGFEPVAPGDPPSERVPKLLRAECELSVLSQKLGEVLGESP